MNEEYKKFLALPFEKREGKFFELYPSGSLLKDKLLAVGGERVVWLPIDPHLDLLIKNGQTFSLDKRKKTKGEVNRCHDNVARLFLKKDIQIVTGYALGGDRWLQHSWGYDGKRIWETTVPFDAYFGVILSDVELFKFIINQIGKEIPNLPKEQLLKIPLPDHILKMYEADQRDNSKTS